MRPIKLFLLLFFPKQPKVSANVGSSIPQKKPPVVPQTPHRQSRLLFCDPLTSLRHHVLHICVIYAHIYERSEAKTQQSRLETR